MHRGMVRLAAATLIGSVLFGCASNGGYKAYAPAAAPIKSIVLLTPKNPDSYVIINQGTPSGALGMAGAIAAMSGDGAKQAQMNKLLTTGGFDFSAQFTERLRKQLLDAGYSVSVVPAERKASMKMAQLPAAAAGADAVIDTAVWHVGYGNVSIIDTPYRPAIKVDVQMTRNGAKVYSESLMYGYHNRFMSATDLDAPARYYFNGYDGLLRDPAKLREGLDLGMDMIAAHVAQQLDPNHKAARR